MAEKELINEETVNQKNLQEEYMKNMEKVEEQQIVDGKVLTVIGDQVYLDIGLKSEGKIPLSEFDETPKEGDMVKVVLVKIEDRHGCPVVSKKQYDEKKVLIDIKDAEKNGTPIKGKITKVVKGGFEVTIGPTLKGFLPISKADVVKIEDQEPYIGITSMFFIERSGNEKKLVKSELFYFRNKLLNE